MSEIDNTLGSNTSATSTITAIRPLTRDFLNWVSEQPRSYEDAMEAWRSSCPRLTIWEDAIDDGLVRVENLGSSFQDATVVLTREGRLLLDCNVGGGAEQDAE